MVNIISTKEGFGIYQKDENKRLCYWEFLQLLEHLKLSFPHSFVTSLYNDQSGYVFFTTELEIKSEISRFEKNLKKVS